MTATVPPQLEAGLTNAAIKTFARVQDSPRVTDLAVALAPGQLAVIRCVDRVCPEDQTALATMIAGGDFIWGAIVYSEGAAPDPLGLIECFHVGALDQLIMRLRELRGVFDEAR